jgi:HPt (histidine-containing phosphotransfer) domain-containing protein
VEDSSNQNAIIDWTVFSQARSELGHNFIRILGYFREDGEKSVARMEEAMQARNAAALVLPAHTMKSESRQFGAMLLAAIAERIENAARLAVENRMFPDEILPEVARLRPLYQETMGLFERESNPLAQRRPAAARAANNQEFGRL